MDDAVQRAARAARSGETVLLSPACASLDMFRDYAHRGDVFAGRRAEAGSMNAAALAFARSSARPRRFVFDSMLLLTVGAIAAARPRDDDVGVDLDRRPAGARAAALSSSARSVGVALGLLAAADRDGRFRRIVWERLACRCCCSRSLLLVIVLIPGIGHEVNGSRRWLRVGFMNFQASELARVLLLTYLASYVVRKQAELKQELKGFLKPLGVLMGAAAAAAAGAGLRRGDRAAWRPVLGVLFLAGVKLRHFLALVALAAGGMALIAVTSAYRLKRLTAFLDPWADPFNSGFQLTQSLIAIGRGELFGVGLGSSVQKLFYLPEAHTDFVFAVLAEELGLAGVIVTLALVRACSCGARFTSRAWRPKRACRFRRTAPPGSASGSALQTFINVGVNMGMLPTKGLTLPLMSYGGSSMLVTLGWLGLLMRIHHEASVAGRLAVLAAGA